MRTAVSLERHSDLSSTIDIREYTKMVPRCAQAARPERAFADFGPRFGEYPVVLATKRTWSLQADRILGCRETAPNAVWSDARSRPLLPWERGE
ncbi:MAG: hypothetical protein ACT4QC_07025 [Planctomycetaceae bacterium]